MGKMPEPSSEKFQEYRRKLLAVVESGSREERQRAQYELSLMEESRFVEAGGILHHYHDSGPADAKETVLLIHGWDCWWMWWHHIINYLNERGIRTIAYDMRGHGWSANDPSNNYHIDNFANDLEEIVRKLGLKAFHIAAFSFGPFVALDYVNKHKNTVKSMVFFNFGYLPNSEFISSFSSTAINTVFNGLLRGLTWWLPAYIFARLVLSRNSVMHHDILIGFASLGLCANEAIRQTTEQITAIDTTNALPGMVRNVEAPILFVAGDGDAIMTAENTKKLQEMTGKGSYVCVPQCGHLITLELPETTSELIFEHVMSHA